jgi:hypothetical protein
VRIPQLPQRTGGLPSQVTVEVGNITGAVAGAADPGQQLGGRRGTGAGGAQPRQGDGGAQRTTSRTSPSAASAAAAISSRPSRPAAARAVATVAGLGSAASQASGPAAAGAASGNQVIIPPIELATTVVPTMTPTLPPSVAKAFPQLNDALQALSKPATIAEIEAVWWSDGLEIWSGQAAAKHVNGFNSLFGHQARVAALDRACRAGALAVTRHGAQASLPFEGDL